MATSITPVLFTDLPVATTLNSGDQTFVIQEEMQGGVPKKVFKRIDADKIVAAAIAVESGTFTPSNGASGSISPGTCIWKKYGKVVWVFIHLNSVTSSPNGGVNANSNLPSSLLPANNIAILPNALTAVGNRNIIMTLNTSGNLLFSDLPSSAASWSSGGVDFSTCYIVN